MRPAAPSLLVCFALLTSAVANPQTQPAAPSASNPEKIIIDTDIGDDIDDAFAVALAIRSPELQILGITTTFGDTEARARIVDRMLGETARSDIPVLAGIPTPTKNPMSQRRYGDAGRFTRASHPPAVDFILDQIGRYPGQITLVAIGPLINIGALIDRDPATFLKLKRVVMMGGSVKCGYSEPGICPGPPPVVEWNILNDIPSAGKLFSSGIPLYVMPLDSTQLKLDETKRSYLFRQGTPLTDALTLLYHEWNQQTPTLFDPLTLAFILDPKICPVEPMHIRVDDKGFTRPEPGAPNAEVCLHSDSAAFFHLLIDRLVAPQPAAIPRLAASHRSDQLRSAPKLPPNRKNISLASFSLAPVFSRPAPIAPSTFCFAPSPPHLGNFFLVRGQSSRSFAPSFPLRARVRRSF